MIQRMKCPKCDAKIEHTEAKAPGSEHKADYWACTATGCDWFAVERNAEHEASLKPKDGAK